MIFPIATLLAATEAMRAVLAGIRADGSPINVLPRCCRFAEFLDFIGLPEIRELEQLCDANHSESEEVEMSNTYEKASIEHRAGAPDDRRRRSQGGRWAPRW